MGAMVTLASGSAVQDAAVKLFGRRWGGPFSVNSKPVISGYTGSEGKFVFPVNPFTLDTSEAMIYTNFLVQAIYAQDTAYAWMPISEVGSAYFANPATVYMVKLKFSH